jgi:hypothetical protein
LPLESVAVELVEVPTSATETPVVPDTTPEMVYPEVVLVTEPEPLPVTEPLPVCVGGLFNATELPLPLHAASEMQAKDTSAANKRVGRHMNVPCLKCHCEGRVLWEKIRRRKVSLTRDQI